MSGPTRTNPMYAHLSYQAAIRDAVVELIMEKYVGNESAAPEREIECLQLIREDAIVPVNEILHFVEEIKNNKAHIDRELACFEFVRRNDAQRLGFRPSYKSLHPSKSGSTVDPQQEGAPRIGEAAAKRQTKRKAGRRRKEESA